MSDQSAPKRERSVVNALGILNKKRAEMGLKKASTKPVPPKKIALTGNQRNLVALEVIQELYPEALVNESLVYTPKMDKEIKSETEKRLKEIQKGTRPLPKE